MAPGAMSHACRTPGQRLSCRQRSRPYPAQHSPSRMLHCTRASACPQTGCQLTTEPSASASVASRMLSAVAPYALDSRDSPPLSARPPTPTTLHTPSGAASLQGRVVGDGCGSYAWGGTQVQQCVRSLDQKYCRQLACRLTPTPPTLRRPPMQRRLGIHVAGQRAAIHHSCAAFGFHIHTAARCGNPNRSACGNAWLRQAHASQQERFTVRWQAVDQALNSRQQRHAAQLLN